jgi:pilus assembly protein CpaC
MMTDSPRPQLKRTFLKLLACSTLLFTLFATANAQKIRGEKDTEEVTEEYLTEKLRSKSKVKTYSVRLQTNVDKVIDLPFEPSVEDDRIVVGNSEVVRPIFIADKKQVILKPRKPGEASITVRDQTGDIRLIFAVKVTSRNLDKKRLEIKEILQDVEGVEVKIVGEKIVMDGEIIVPEDMNRILAVTQNYDGVINLTSFSPVAQKMIAKMIEKDLKEQLGLPEVRVRALNCRFFLEGQVDSAGQASLAMDIAMTYAPDTVVSRAVAAKVVKKKTNKCGIKNLLTVKDKPPPAPKKMIKVITQFVELSKDYMNSFGFKWQPGISVNEGAQFGEGVGGGIAATANSIAGTINNLLPKLNKAKQSGKARVLETAVGITQDKEELRLDKVTNFPFTVTQSTGEKTIKTIKYGLRTAVTPERMGGENSEIIQLRINFNLNIPTGTKPGGIPVVTTNSVKTILSVKHTQSAAIAGILRKGSIWGYNKDNGKQPADPLFTFLRSRSFNTDKSQFVVFVTPYMIDDASKGSEDIKKKFRIK